MEERTLRMLLTASFIVSTSCSSWGKSHSWQKRGHWEIMIFVSRAPEAKIAQEREKQAKYRQMMEQVKERLGQLGQ